MEVEEIFLNQNICQECGLPLIVDSYEKKVNSEAIFIKLKCQNLEHKKINDLNFEDYHNKLIKKKLNNICKCTICKNVIINNTNTYYCYICRKIICSDCKINKHNKNHKDIYEFNILKNKCLIHNNNDISYYCLLCKRNMCQNCLNEDFSHYQNNNIHSINNLIIFNQNNIKMIQEEKDILSKKIRNLTYQIIFNDFLIKENSHYFHLFNFDNNIRNSIQNNNLYLDTNKVESGDFERNKEKSNNSGNSNEINNNKENNSINFIYHNENITNNKGDYVIRESQKFQSATKASLILTNDISKLNMVLNYLLKIKTKSKFLLIVNGRSAEAVINFINNEKNKNYRSLFISACIYTGNIKNYDHIQNKYSDFYAKIFDNESHLIQYLKSFLENINTEKSFINSLIDIESFKIKDFLLYQELSSFYGDESQDSFNNNFSIFQNYINKENIEKNIKISLISCLKTFSELNIQKYETIISVYLKDYYFAKYLNLLLKQKDLSLYKKIGYFAGNLMYSLVKYGESKNKIVKTVKNFYTGTELNIIEVLEFLKNRENRYKIAFPYFLSMTTKKDLAELFSKRNINYNKRKQRNLFSVVMKINYFLDDIYEPCAFELKDLSQYKDEEEYILLPFTFMKVNKVIIDSDKLISDIELEVIGKKKSLEE